MRINTINIPDEVEDPENKHKEAKTIELVKSEDIDQQHIFFNRNVPVYHTTNSKVFMESWGNNDMSVNIDYVTSTKRYKTRRECYPPDQFYKLCQASNSECCSPTADSVKGELSCRGSLMSSRIRIGNICKNVWNFFRPVNRKNHCPKDSIIFTSCGRMNEQIEVECSCCENYSECCKENLRKVSTKKSSIGNSDSSCENEEKLRKYSYRNFHKNTKTLKRSVSEKNRYLVKWKNEELVRTANSSEEKVLFVPIHLIKSSESNQRKHSKHSHGSNVHEYSRNAKRNIKEKKTDYREESKDSKLRHGMNVENVHRHPKSKNTRAPTDGSDKSLSSEISDDKNRVTKELKMDQTLSKPKKSYRGNKILVILPKLESKKGRIRKMTQKNSKLKDNKFSNKTFITLGTNTSNVMITDELELNSIVLSDSVKKFRQETGTSPDSGMYISSEPINNGGEYKLNSVILSNDLKNLLHEEEQHIPSGVEENTKIRSNEVELKTDIHFDSSEKFHSETEKDTPLEILQYSYSEPINYADKLELMLSILFDIIENFDQEADSDTHNDVDVLDPKLAVPSDSLEEVHKQIGTDIASNIVKAILDKVDEIKWKSAISSEPSEKLLQEKETATSIKSVEDASCGPTNKADQLELKSAITPDSSEKLHQETETNTPIKSVEDASCEPINKADELVLKSAITSDSSEKLHQETKTNTPFKNLEDAFSEPIDKADELELKSAITCDSLEELHQETETNTPVKNLEDVFSEPIYKPDELGLNSTITFDFSEEPHQETERYTPLKSVEDESSEPRNKTDKLELKLPITSDYSEKLHQETQTDTPLKSVEDASSEPINKADELESNSNILTNTTEKHNQEVKANIRSEVVADTETRTDDPELSSVILFDSMKNFHQETKPVNPFVGLKGTVNESNKSALESAILSDSEENLHKEKRVSILSKTISIISSESINEATNELEEKKYTVVSEYEEQMVENENENEVGIADILEANEIKEKSVIEMDRIESREDSIQINSSEKNAPLVKHRMNFMRTNNRNEEPYTNTDSEEEFAEKEVTKKLKIDKISTNSSEMVDRTNILGEVSELENDNLSRDRISGRKMEKKSTYELIEHVQSENVDKEIFTEKTMDQNQEKINKKKEFSHSAKRLSSTTTNFEDICPISVCEEMIPKKMKERFQVKFDMKEKQTTLYSTKCRIQKTPPGKENDPVKPIVICNEKCSRDEACNCIGTNCQKSKEVVIQSLNYSRNRSLRRQHSIRKCSARIFMKVGVRKRQHVLRRKECEEIIEHSGPLKKINLESIECNCFKFSSEASNEKKRRYTEFKRESIRIIEEIMKRVAELLSQTNENVVDQASKRAHNLIPIEEFAVEKMQEGNPCDNRNPFDLAENSRCMPLLKTISLGKSKLQKENKLEFFNTGKKLEFNSKVELFSTSECGNICLCGKQQNNSYPLTLKISEPEICSTSISIGSFVKFHDFSGIEHKSEYQEYAYTPRNQINNQENQCGKEKQTLNVNKICYDEIFIRSSDPVERITIERNFSTAKVMGEDLPTMLNLPCKCKKIFAHDCLEGQSEMKMGNLGEQCYKKLEHINATTTVNLNENNNSGKVLAKCPSKVSEESMNFEGVSEYSSNTQDARKKPTKNHKNPFLKISKESCSENISEYHLCIRKNRTHKKSVTKNTKQKNMKK